MHSIPLPLRRAITRTIWVLAGSVLLFIASCRRDDGNMVEDMQSPPEAGRSSVDGGMGSESGTLTISFQPMDGPGTLDGEEIEKLLTFNVKVNGMLVQCPYKAGQWICDSLRGDIFIEIVPESTDDWEFVEWSIPSCYRMKKCQFSWSDSQQAQAVPSAVRFKYIKDQIHVWPSAVRLFHQDLAYTEPSIFSPDGKRYIYVSNSDKYVQKFVSSGGMTPSVWLATEGGFLLNCSKDCVIDGRLFHVSNYNLLGLSIDVASSRIWISGVAGYLGFTRTDMPSSMATQVKNIPKTVNLNAVWSVTWRGKHWAVAVGDRSTILVVAGDELVPANTKCTESGESVVWRAVSGPDQPDSSATTLDVWAVATSGKICKIILNQDGSVMHIPIPAPMEYEMADINAVSVIKREKSTEVWALVFAPLPGTGQPRRNLLLQLGTNMSPPPIKIRDSSDLPLTALWIGAQSSFAFAAGRSGIHRIRLPNPS